jgi:hypothetical protein
MNRYRQRDAAPLKSLPSNHPFHGIAKWVMRLVTLFFSLSIVFFILAVIADKQHPDTISIYVWGRAITELVLGTAYFLFVYLWKKGKFWGYLRMLMTSALAGVSTLSVVMLHGSYPWWLRLEQAIQFLVPAVIILILTRPQMRHRFSKKTVAAAEKASKKQ